MRLRNDHLLDQITGKTMRSCTLLPAAFLLCLMLMAGPGLAGSELAQTQDYGSTDDDDLMAELGADYGGQDGSIADPLEPWNRLMFTVNDKLYFWVMEPVARGYAAALPEPWRNSFDQAFYNAATPVRLVNDLLQFRPVDAAQELGACVINTLFGFGGLLKPSEGIAALKPEPPDTDAGLTLGTWGIGHGFYLFWPILGPSSLRDSVGTVGDGFLHPLYYIEPWEVDVAVKAGEGINFVSLNLDRYEELQEEALDPYTAFKDFYEQYRKRALDVDD
ncbi:MAG: VacJ family lipoprotein [Desulfovermiculus sp.]